MYSFSTVLDFTVAEFLFSDSGRTGLHLLLRALTFLSIIFGDNVELIGTLCDGGEDIAFDCVDEEEATEAATEATEGEHEVGVADDDRTDGDKRGDDLGDLKICPYEFDVCESVGVVVLEDVGVCDCEREGDCVEDEGERGVFEEEEEEDEVVEEGERGE